MEAITEIPGLQHISEDVFKLLNHKDLMNCRLVNSSWKNILDQPKFWLEKLNRNYIWNVSIIWKLLAKKLSTNIVNYIKKQFVLVLIKINRQYLRYDIPFFRPNESDLAKFILDMCAS